jgi:FixJ family two-component response regulator
MTPPRPTVHVIDDDPSFRKSVTSLLRAAGHETRAYASVSRFLAAGLEKTAGCILTDLQMPGQSGLHLQRLLADTDSPIPVIFLTAHGDIPASVRAMREGAVDFLTKPIRKKDLLDAVRRGLIAETAARKESALTGELRSAYETLTPREHQVLTHVVAGKLNKQIAFDLGTGERTIKAHRANLMRKLNAGSVAELVHLTYKLGIQRPG